VTDTGDDPHNPQEVTQLLAKWQSGDESALGSLIPMVESELRRLARNYMRGEREGHTLQPTALINEAWLRIVQQPGSQPEFQGRSHFVAIAARHMRQILVEHARKRNAGKRGGPEKAVVPLDEAAAGTPTSDNSLLRLDDGLRDLTELDPRQARIVELHYFGGLTYEEIAEFLQIGRSTVVRDLRTAQAWLKSYVARS
jgi:RNA polymerase sigma factor (TIGR02999 family)